MAASNGLVPSAAGFKDPVTVSANLMNAPSTIELERLFDNSGLATAQAVQTFDCSTATLKKMQNQQVHSQGSTHDCLLQGQVRGDLNLFGLHRVFDNQDVFEASS